MGLVLPAPWTTSATRRSRTDLTGHLYRAIEDGRINSYRVRLAVSFKYETGD